MIACCCSYYMSVDGVECDQFAQALTAYFGAVPSDFIYTQDRHLQGTAIPVCRSGMWMIFTYNNRMDR